MAIIYHKAVQITYAGSYTEAGERKIYPLKLFYKAKAWYVKAYCTKKEDFRLFKLSRILDYKLTEEEFSYRDFPEETKSLQREYNTIMLRFPKKME